MNEQLIKAKAKFFAMYPDKKVVFTYREYDDSKVVLEQEMTGRIISIDFQTLIICAKVQFGVEPRYFDYKPGFGFSSTDCDDWTSGTGVGLRLVFPSPKLTLYFAKQFLSIHNKYLIKQ